MIKNEEARILYLFGAIVGLVLVGCTGEVSPAPSSDVLNTGVDAKLDRAKGDVEKPHR